MNRPALEQALADARAALAGATDGHLERPWRLAIFAALGPAPRDEPPAYAAVVAVAPLVRRALARWEEVCPRDRRPHELVAVALGPADAVEATLEPATDLWYEAVDCGSEKGWTDAAVCAAAAAVELVRFASYGSSRELAADACDDDDDPWGWLPERWSELALTGDDPAANIEERRGLWTWWLDEVVPAAAQAGPRPG